MQQSKIDSILASRAPSLSRDIAGETGLNPARSRDLLHDAVASIGADVLSGRLSPQDVNGALRLVDTHALAHNYGIKAKQVEAALRGVMPRLCNALATADIDDLGSTEAVTRTGGKPKDKKGKRQKH